MFSNGHGKNGERIKGRAQGDKIGRERMGWRLREGRDHSQEMQADRDCARGNGIFF